MWPRSPSSPCMAGAREDSSMAELVGFLERTGFETAHLWLGGYPSMADRGASGRLVRLGSHGAKVVSGDAGRTGGLGERFHIVTHFHRALVVPQCWRLLPTPKAKARRCIIS